MMWSADFEAGTHLLGVVDLCRATDRLERVLAVAPLEVRVDTTRRDPPFQ